MRDQDYTVSADFLMRLFSETLHKVELRACPNERDGGSAHSLMTRDDAEVASFCRRKDELGTGTYFGVCTRRNGATSGNLSTVMECPALWVDIDCAAQGIAGEDALKALQWLPHPPSLIVNSGGGLHAYWLLEESIDVSEGSDRRDLVSGALRRLVDILAGDGKCAELARIMRLPGTRNSKAKTLALYDGKSALCEVVDDTGRVHDFEAIGEWLTEQRAVLHGRVETVRPVREDDPFVAFARSVGYEPAIDIDLALAAMTHEAVGDNSIHQTQLRVSASMIGRGYDDDEIVARILSATETAAPRDARWNWGREEAAIRKMVQTARSKGFGEKVRDRATQGASLQVAGNTALKLVHSAEPEETPVKAKKGEAKDEISILGGATLAAWIDRYGPLLHSAGSTYLYEAGVWSDWEASHDQMLRALLQEGCARLTMKPGSSLLNSAARFVMDHPDYLVRSVNFDEHHLIVANDGCLDLETMTIRGHSPDDYSRFKIGAELRGGRNCSAFLSFLADSFADHNDEEASQIIATLQEWFGSALIANKPRSLRKGLLVHGGSRTGKTQISEILRALLGKGHTTAIKVRDLEKDFGTETLLGKRGWIADDAVGQGETLDAETYKVLVTGEAMSVRRKNKGMIDGFRFGRPVCLTMNNLMKIKDGSDAVYNRSLILPMTNVRPENAAEPVGYDSIADKIIAEELSGVLWWAIEGWQRLKARGIFVPPQCMIEAIRGLQEMNDDVGTWVRECVAADPSYKVAPADLFASFAGWFFQEKGDTKFNWSQNGFSRKIKERLPHIGQDRTGRQRWITGLRINEDGLENWTINSERGELRRTTAASLDAYSVNHRTEDVQTKSSRKTVF